MLPNNIEAGRRGRMGWGWGWGWGEGEEATQHHMKAGEEKKVTLLENWNCMCEFNCALLLMYVIIYLFL